MVPVFRQLIAYMMVLGILFNSLDKLLIVGNYEVNKDYIAKNLCENRAKPCSHCKGKCYMRKQMRENEQKESVPPGNDIKEKFQQQLFCESKAIYLSNSVIDFQYSSYINFAPTVKFVTGVFHPPTV